MKAVSRWGLFVAVAVVVMAESGRAQQPAAAAPPAVGPKVGEMAPDFEFTGITRYGMLSQKHKLSDFRGSTVVLAFFPKARTRG